MEIKSDLDLFNKAYTGEILIGEVQNYIENKYASDAFQIQMLEVELTAFKLKEILQFIKTELQNDPEYITMELNYEHYNKPFPLVGYLLENPKIDLSDLDILQKHRNNLKIELEKFLEIFAPTKFIGLKRIESVIDGILYSHKTGDNIGHSSPQLKWKGNQVEFFEVFKGLKESGLLKIDGSEDTLFKYLSETFNYPDFSLRGARQNSKKRLERINVYDFVGNTFERWRNS